jgi:hypothetical protein
MRVPIVPIKTNQKPGFSIYMKFFSQEFSKNRLALLAPLARLRKTKDFQVPISPGGANLQIGTRCGGLAANA